VVEYHELKPYAMPEVLRVCDFALTATRRDGTLAGTWTSTLDGQALKGDLAGTVAPLPQPAPGFELPAPGEHPCLLSRKTDIPALLPLCQVHRQRRGDAALTRHGGLRRIGIRPHAAGGIHHANRAGRGLHGDDQSGTRLAALAADDPCVACRERRAPVPRLVGYSFLAAPSFTG
jgi:hypothetical protein